MSNREGISQEEFESVENYLLDRMSKEERSSFESRLKAEPNLKLQFEDTKAILLGMDQAIMKEKIDSLHTAYESGSDTHQSDADSKVVSLLRKPWLVAASVILLALVGTTYFLFQGNDNQRLYAKHFQADPGLPTTMSTTNNYDFYSAMVDYKRGEYDRALAKWNKLLDKAPENDTLNYFIGVAELANSNEAASITPLTIVTNNKESIFLNEAYHFLGLSFLKQDRKGEAMKRFMQSTLDASKSILSELEE